ncbi:hypothetical protein L596_009750 [Steinernema carpocapsae]|uniref:Transmembrane protein n=1 Tax=Steinernema carpocapsae TaxID=34508 RepID=A0A4U5PG88_STECR|nr:hypothetical protein L596_009750 [Steinernema carpocapsae]
MLRPPRRRKFLSARFALDFVFRELVARSVDRRHSAPSLSRSAATRSLCPLSSSPSQANSAISPPSRRRKTASNVFATIQQQLFFLLALSLPLLLLYFCPMQAVLSACSVSLSQPYLGQRVPGWSYCG